MHNISAKNLGIEFDEATVSFLYHNINDSVLENDSLMELTTAKAVIVIESPVAGCINKIIEIDSTVAVDTVLCQIEA